MEYPVMENRELSWLRFNQRVLEEAQSKQVPLLERLGFTAIFQSNLDEFFRVRVAKLLKKKKQSPKEEDALTGMTPKQLLHAIYDQVRTLSPARDAAYHEIMSELRDYGLEQITMQSASASELTMLSEWFKREIRPIAMPLIADKGKPLPFFRDRALYVILHLESKSGVRMGIVPITDQYPRLIRLGGGRFILAEDVILAYAHTLFRNSVVIDRTIMRMTRSASLETEALGDLRTGDQITDMETLLQMRKRLPVIRMELSETFCEPALHFLCKQLKLKHHQIFYAKAPLDLSFAFQCKDLLPLPQLQYERLVPQLSAAVNPKRSMFSQIRKQDLLLHYPYESIRSFLRLLEEAADDPAVVSIQITLYRMARDSRVIAALCEAAGHGKQVTALTELRARFDEEANIQWAKTLEHAGVHVIFGPDGYKVHSKLLLIERKMRGKIERFTQIGTGNYNEKTASLYTDYCLMTANPQIGEEAACVFSALKEQTLPQPQTLLLVAPYGLQSRVLEAMDAEIQQAKLGNDAYIGLRLNGLCDKIIMKKLIEASCAGVKIELLIRGICCLIPGVPEQTEQIAVRSIVGRYLEHARVYLFGSGERMQVYLGSADFMPRNTMRRVEICTPILDPALKDRLFSDFQLQFHDSVKARIRQSDGDYLLPSPNSDTIDSQTLLHRSAYPAPDDLS